jgi:TPR repeat protein
MAYVHERLAHDRSDDFQVVLTRYWNERLGTPARRTLLMGIALGVLCLPGGRAAGQVRRAPGCSPITECARRCSGGEGAVCLDLGRLYGSGRRVPQDFARAADLYRRGCDLKDARACSWLAFNYSVGMGIAKDFERAKSFAQVGCDGGDARAARCSLPCIGGARG